MPTVEKPHVRTNRTAALSTAAAIRSELEEMTEVFGARAASDIAAGY
jgi:hypothetical protein